MKVIKYIFLFLLLVIVAGAIYIATLEKSYDISRTKIIKAPIGVIFEKVNDYKNMPSWSPWIALDSNSTRSYSKVTSGKGASYGWKGEIIGEGGLETIEVITNEVIKQKYKSIKPFESEADIYWNFKPVDNRTEVTWGMKGDMDFSTRAYMAFSGGMDNAIGPDYERGLFKLDSVVQADMKKYSIRVNGITTRGGGFYLYNTASCKIEELPTKMQEMLPQVIRYAKEHRIRISSGALFVLYHNYDEENNAVMFSCAVPIAERVITESGSGILTGMLQPFKALKTTLKGNYSNLKEAWDFSNKYLKENALLKVEGEPTLVVYLNDPAETPNPADWVTEIYIPIK